MQRGQSANHLSGIQPLHTLPDVIELAIHVFKLVLDTL
ncbi:hypothetical protein PAERUG_E3_London_17_VIM_2_03_09_01227 [Pseudomonas aeruginosa]|nr:hypothetical protein PAERUG_E3_London_17_VIM_2_03_09_01227 [Pseudomonas aeruginosa]CRQ93309.1 hypothetical protein PAERUG_E15_London_28_01_14_06995 [Pseudomonas aeruginosa]CRR04391.1 hypothetical protein PAERUG_P55_London_26_VIM_2_05_13_00201 [Pseudomonas aeruginosa]CRW66129.1 hypothetical protein PAERUG_P9_East_of_England_6_IMP_13_08_09_00874 [Pseudomonas aeruginosa]